MFQFSPMTIIKSGSDKGNQIYDLVRYIDYPGNNVNLNFTKNADFKFTRIDD